MTAYEGLEVMSAPNRFRKLFRDEQLLAPLDEESCVEAPGSDAVKWMFVGGFDAFRREEAAELMRSEWPEKAHRVIGMEPAFDMADVVLLWRSAQ